MRNTTKLKRILAVYDVNVHTDDNEQFKMVIIHKTADIRSRFEARNWGNLLSKAYLFYNKNKKQQHNGEQDRDGVTSFEQQHNNNLDNA